MELDEAQIEALARKAYLAYHEVEYRTNWEIGFTGWEALTSDVQDRWVAVAGAMIIALPPTHKGEALAGILNVFVVAGHLHVFQAKVQELGFQKVDQHSVVINGVRFRYVTSTNAARGFDQEKTRYLALHEAWLRSDLLEFLEGEYSHLTEEEFELIRS